jgi:hypothetical protein
MEIDLAERILVRYKDMKSLLSTIRNTYLLKKNKQQRKNLQEEKEKVVRQEKIKTEAEAIFRMKKAFKMILKNRDKKSKEKNKSLSVSMNDINRSLNIEKSSKEQKSRLNDLANQKFSNLMDPANPKVRKHKYHPSSKLLRNSQRKSLGEEKQLWGEENSA